MKNRGVTRPMARHADHEQKSSHQGSDRMSQLQEHHSSTLWIYWTLIGLGIWLLVSPFSFGYLNPDLWVDPSGGRGAWWSQSTHTQLRAWLVTTSELLSGLGLVIFGWRSLTPNRPISLWICCAIGAWLTFAPIVLWSPLSVAFLNDSLIGAAVIALTILIPGMPNMMKYMKMGPSTPPGWSYNPSSWPQRWIMIVLGFFGWLVSRYLAAFQLGYIDYVWDPFFGFANGTQRVLNSDMSHAWPISDAGLGAISYTFEFLMGWMGSPSRWRTMPWMVTFFGILVIPLGLTHIFLVISQPVVVGYWCTMCLLAAIIMLPMIPLEADEVIAMIGHMKDAKARGDRGGSLWKVFWMGGSAEGSREDKRSPSLVTFPQNKLQVFKASIWGFSLPWTLVVTSLLGLWLMFTPTLFDSPKLLSKLLHPGGALIITVSIISMGEVLRTGRFLNILLGLTTALAPWFLSGVSTANLWNCGIIGVLVALLSIKRGPIMERYGFWQRYIL